VIEVLRAAKVTSVKRTGSPVRIAAGIFLAMGVYAGCATIWGIDPAEEFSLLAIGAIMVMGMSRLFTSALDSNGSMALVLRACFLAILVATAFFALESSSRYWLASQVPGLIKPTYTEIILISTLLLAFSAVVFIQIVAPVLSATPFYRAMAVHLRNGLYLNAIFDRLIGALHIPAPPQKPAFRDKVEKTHRREPIEIEIYEEQPA
jgi:NAD(P)H-quinone oxidoreductase subunit 5